MTHQDPTPQGCYVPYPNSPGYPAIPLYPQPEAPGASFTTNTFSLPAPEPKYSAKIFTDVDEANEFMEDAVVQDVQVCSYETATLEGLLIVVFYEVEEA